MDRILKFRVWDKLAKYMYYSDEVGAHHFTLSLNGKITNLQNGAGGDDFIVQQFTGLIDKNGKEIYEGDIVETRDTKSPTEGGNLMFGYVEWTNWNSAFSFVCNIGYLNEPKNLHPFGMELLSAELTQILGNILEYPELLDKESYLKARPPFPPGPHPGPWGPWGPWNPWPWWPFRKKNKDK